MTPHPWPCPGGASCWCGAEDFERRRAIVALMEQEDVNGKEVALGEETPAHMEKG